MTHPAPPGHGTTAPTATISPQEWDMFRADDRQAARNIVCLLTAIFAIGLVGYVLVCIWTYSMGGLGV